MALDFLSSIAQGEWGKGLEGLSGTINSAAGPLQQILNAFGKKKTQSAPSLREQIESMATNFPQSEAERQAISLLQAIGQPGNSYVKALQDEEFQNLRGGVQSDIKSKVLADRREQSMGRSPVFFDPERADENINYQISRGTPMLKQQASQNAIERILKAAGVGSYAANADNRAQGNLNAMASLYAMDTLAPSQSGAKMQTQLPGLFGRAQEGLTGLQEILKIFKNAQPETYGPPKPETIRWNQMRYNG